MLKIVDVQKKEWEAFLKTQKNTGYPFFQTWEWGEVQKKLGFFVKRVGIIDKSLVGTCLIVDVKARRGRYLHLRHGPVFSTFNEKNFDFFIDYTRKLAKERGASFIRLSPLLPKEKAIEEYFKQKRFLPSAIHNMDAEICWALPLDVSEEELLKQMRKSHRYLIKKSMTMGIKIVRTQNISEIDRFISLYIDLSQRKHFIPHQGIKEEFKEFSKSDKEISLLANYQGKIISGAIIAFVGDLAIYRHSASLYEYRNIPASYLIQWNAILEAKKRGLSLYNFWGIAPTDSKNHPWQGLTLFKTGFGGKKLEFLHAHDLPVSNKYLFTFLIESIQKKLKGY